MNGSENILSLMFRAFIADARITVWHIATYVALLELWKSNQMQNPFRITRKQVMEMAHIGSIVTYHKCIKDLQQYLYIDYIPSYHPLHASSISILPVNAKK